MKKRFLSIQKNRAHFCKIFLFVFIFTTLVIPANITIAYADICNHWAETSITKWKNYGIVSGYPDGSFRPDTHMTKAEFITILNHIYGFHELTSENYTDVTDNDWFCEQVAIAKNSPYMAWYSKSALQPNSNITRQEVCAMIASIQHLDASDTYSNVEPFDDSKAIPEWSISYLDAFVQNGYISGYPDKTLRPTGLITRAEVMTILDKSTGYFINKSGNYGSEGEIEIYEGNLTINNPDVSLKNIIVKGHLILAAGIEQGDVALTNVTVVGKTIINGGGEHSITFTNSNLGELLVYKQDDRIRIVATNSTIGKTILLSNANLLLSETSEVSSIQILGQAKTVKLDGNYDQITLETAAQVTLSDNSKIGSLEIASNANGSFLTIGAQSKVNQITFNGNANVNGEGSIDKAIINVNGVTIKQPVTNQVVSDGVTDNSSSVPSNSSRKTSSGSSSGTDSPRDTTAPSGYVAVIDVANVDSSNNTDFSFTLSGAEVGATCLYTISSDGGGADVTGSETITNANQQISGIDVSALHDGILTLSIKLTDASLNSGIQTTNTVTKDADPPTGYGVVINQTIINQSSQDALAFTLSGAEVGATCFYTISSDGGGADVTGSETITNANQQILGIDVTSLADATLTLSVRLTDSNGHIGTDVTDTVFKDIVSPLGYGASIDIANVDNTNNTNFAFTLNNAEIGATCAYTISSDAGGTDVTGNTIITSADQEISGIDVSSLSDGTLTLSIILTDAALNTGIASTDTVTKDADPPSGYSVAIDQNQINAVNQTTVSFTFASAEMNATYDYTLVGSGGIETVTGSGTITAEDLQVSGIDVTSLAEGTLTLTARLTDSVGHVGADVTDTVLKDITPPIGYGVSIDPVRVNTTNINSFAFTLSNAEIGTTCIYSISSDGGGTDVTGNTTVTSENQQVLGIDVSTLSDGTLTLSIVLKDTALNSGAASTDTVTKDTTAPNGYSASIDQSNIHPQNQTAISFTFANAEVGSTYAYTVSSNNGGTPLTGNGTISTSSDQITGLDTSGLADGILTLSCTLTDSDNNVGNAGTTTVRKSPYADLQISGYDLVNNADGTPSNTPGNGIYTYQEMYNGKPSYILTLSSSDTFLLRWYDSGYGDEWSMINLTDNNEYVYYFMDSDTPLPPTTGWKYTTAITTIDSDFSITVVTP